MNSKIDYKRLNFKVAREILQGKNIVFTGRGFLVRGELMRLARQAGANVDSVVTKKCDILIVGEKPGSKLRKAKILGCEIITTDYFKDILEGKIQESKLVNNNEDILDFNLINETNILNIGLDNKNEERINIENKNIAVFIKNEILKQKTILNVKKYGGNLLETLDEEIVDLVVYQPHSDFDYLIKRAEMLNIKLFTVGNFNKLIMA